MPIWHGYGVCCFKHRRRCRQSRITFLTRAVLPFLFFCRGLLALQSSHVSIHALMHACQHTFTHTHTHTLVAGALAGGINTCVGVAFKQQGCPFVISPIHSEYVLCRDPGRALILRFLDFPRVENLLWDSLTHIPPVVRAPLCVEAASVTKTKGRTAWSRSSCAAGVWVDLRLLLCYPQARNAEAWCPGRGPSGPFQPLPMGTAARSGVEVISARKESPGWSRRTLMFFRFTLPPAILRYVSVMLSRSCDHNLMTELQRRIFCLVHTPQEFCAERECQASEVSFLLNSVWPRGGFQGGLWRLPWRDQDSL